MLWRQVFPDHPDGVRGVLFPAKEADRKYGADDPNHSQDDDFGEVVSPDNSSVGGKVNLRNLGGQEF
jgi:hypothetical protein